MCPMCMTAIAATVVGLGSAGSITAFVATKLRSSTREQDAPKRQRLPVYAGSLSLLSSSACSLAKSGSPR